MSFPCLGQAGAGAADRDRAASGLAAPSGLSDRGGSIDRGCAGAVMMTHTLSSACTQLRDLRTGYSSLSHRRRLPVDEVKIDTSFVVDMAAREDDALIVC